MKSKITAIGLASSILALSPIFATPSYALKETSINVNSDSQHHAVQRVLLISVDGLHASDLANYVKNHPHSNLAALSNHGITYTNASTSKPSDSFPGLLSLVTGGSPNSTGVFYDDSYDRKLLPPIASKAGDKPGTEVLYDESIDNDFSKLDGGGGMNPDALPRDPVTKKPVYPHNYLRVNTIFEVIKAAGKRTAWADKHLAYDLVNGPSGKGVDDLYTPEIAANGDATTSIASTEANDDLKVAALLNEIDGKDHKGTKSAPVPTIFGMNFQAVSVAQKLPGNGYTDGNGTFSNGLAEALTHTDESIGKITNELKKQHLFDSTLIIITAKHGQSPIDPAKLKITDKSLITEGVPSDLIAQVTADDVALIWLTDQSKIDSVVAAIKKNKEKANIKDVYSFSNSKSQWIFNNPLTDSRVPDIVVQPNEGVIYTKPGKKIAEHGGFSHDDTNVALLVSFAGIGKAQQNTAPVQTMQVAPTILKMLGLDPHALQAVQIEHTQILPGIQEVLEKKK
ncbi:phosphodiesterase [Collibacillus ludicampi]|uniref:Phosphodiesterase n=1 Tax=Collibacillus ludicampi TaxID=2771369 RepID=A0AAV4LJP2_9BACL|nr:alkaline phosphatase family protein [Collibacillus ludicampi]GIM48067.1 phosphodiesterase [Collibacillus ludicampi]